MIKKIKNTFKGFEIITKKIMKNGLIFCFTLCFISLIILITYNFILSVPVLYYIGINLFRLGLIFAIEFIICGFITDSIKKQMI